MNFRQRLYFEWFGSNWTRFEDVFENIDERLEKLL